MATHCSILAGEFYGLYSPWGHKELDTTERLSLHFSERVSVSLGQEAMADLGEPPVKQDLLSAHLDTLFGQLHL